jgi:hypothetical protein
MTYSLLNDHIDRIDNMSPVAVPVSANATDYLSVADVLYPGIGYEAGDLQSYLYFTVIAILANERIMHLKLREIFLLPLTLQNYVDSDIALMSLVNASRCEETYRISVSNNSILSFTVLSLFILLWSLALLGVAWRSQTPEVSSFPDLDFVSRLPSEVNCQEISEVCSQVSRVKHWRVGQEIDTVKLCALEKVISDDSSARRNTETYELNDI